MLKEHATEYYAAKNFNGWYVFGVLAMVVLAIQLITGHLPDDELQAVGRGRLRLRRVHHAGRRVGWLIRYMHSTGASAFFIVVYLHMFRAMMYGSYKNPRELLWLIGMVIYLALMAEGFLGYLLPWGQMSYWGAQVIVSRSGRSRHRRGAGGVDPRRLFHLGTSR